MVYAAWLFGLSLVFLLAERLWPETPRKVLRRGFFQDLGYLIFYGEYFGLLLGIFSMHAVRVLDQALEAGGVRALVYRQIFAGQPLWVQFPLLLLSFDFAQWLIHNLLHRVGWLWEFHKLHHSLEEMDWLGNWRFHWMEVVIYRSLLYVPAALLGFSAEAMFCYGVVNTFAGHFTHSNLRFRIGPLRYVFNSPEMHAWHHAHPDAGPVNRNFGVTLSIWDWIFGTAYLPQGSQPARLGFAGIESYPRSILGRTVAPFRRGRRPFPGSAGLHIQCLPPLAANRPRPALRPRDIRPKETETAHSPRRLANRPRIGRE
jgi:sterol desaturase/sphingolipid hydroxylase (fatty acid hydroxylase superfamily)